MYQKVDSLYVPGIALHDLVQSVNGPESDIFPHTVHILSLISSGEKVMKD